MIRKNIDTSLLSKGKESHKLYELILSLFAIFTVLLAGTLGYILIEGWHWFDALYMTVITLTTVGFGEVHPLSEHGRLFTIVIMLLGVGVAMLVLTTLAKIALEQQIFWIFERKGMQKLIDSLSKHTIVCGYGRLSNVAVQRLAEHGTPLVVVDVKEDRILAAENSGYLAVQGDAAEEEVLLRAGVKRASRLVSLLPKDSDNLYVILTAKELNPDIFIVSHAEDDVGEKRMRQAGAQRIISPYRVGGNKVAEGLLRPHVTEFLDIAATGADGDLMIEEILIPEKSPMDGRTLQESELRQKTNIIVAAVISKAGSMKFNPSGDTLIESGATLIGMGHRRDFGALEKLLIVPSERKNES